MTGTRRGNLPTSAIRLATATLFVLCVLAGATGCGQTGPLYLPTDADTRQPADEPQPGTGAADEQSGSDSDDDSNDAGA